jgi:hypothetical protein
LEKALARLPWLPLSDTPIVPVGAAAAGLARPPASGSGTIFSKRRSPVACLIKNGKKLTYLNLPFLQVLHSSPSTVSDRAQFDV